MLRFKLREAYYQKIIQKSTGGVRKYLPSGITDVTTPTKHIEIKTWNSYKHSLGQLLAYDHYDKKEILEVHLFSADTKYPDEKKQIAIEVFTKYNIKVIDLDEKSLIT